MAKDKISTEHLRYLILENVFTESMTHGGVKILTDHLRKWTSDDVEVEICVFDFPQCLIQHPLVLPPPVDKWKVWSRLCA